MSEVVGDERGHWLSIVVGNNTGKKRNGSISALCRKESENSKHGSTAIVDFGTETRFLLVLAHVLGEAEGIVQVEWDRVWDSIRSRGEIGEVTGLSSPHVMCVVRGGELTPEFKEANEAENLPLGGVRDGVPKGGGVSGGIREGSSIHLHRPWELDSVSMDNVSYESKHLL